MKRNVSNYRKGKKVSKYNRKPKYTRRGKNSIYSIRNIGTVFPSVLTCKLKYSQTFNFTSTTTMAYNVYRANDLYDPDYSGTGHQPMGSDQLFTLYNRCLVYASSIEVRASCNTANQSALIGVVPLSTFTAISGDIDLLGEKKNARTKVTNEGGPSAYIKHYGSVKSIRGVNGLNTDDDTYVCTNTASPALIWYWHVLAQNLDIATSTDVHGIVTIHYYCKFFSPKSLAQS